MGFKLEGPGKTQARNHPGPEAGNRRPKDHPLQVAVPPQRSKSDDLTGGRWQEPISLITITPGAPFLLVSCAVSCDHEFWGLLANVKASPTSA